MGSGWMGFEERTIRQSSTGTMHITLVAFVTFVPALTLEIPTLSIEGKNETDLEPYHDGKALHIPLNETASVDLLERWLSQAVSGLMAAFAGHTMEHVKDEDKEELHLCSKGASTIPDHAKCVRELIGKAKQYKKGNKSKDPRKSDHEHGKHKDTEHHQEEDLKWTGGIGQMRVKRDADDDAVAAKLSVHTKPVKKIVTREKYMLQSAAEESAFSQVARYLTKTVRAIKNKNQTETWRETLLKVKQTAEEERALKEQRERLKRKLKHMIDNTPENMADPRRPLAMKQMEMEDEEIETRKKKQMAENEEVRVPLRVLREGVKLGMMMSGQDVSNFDNKTLKLVSPRFMSVVPDDEGDDTINLLSPSLFSLHEDGEGVEALMSLPNILKKLDNSDQQAWMDFIIETSGVSDAVSTAQQKQKEKRRKELLGANEEPLHFTKQNISKEEVKKVEVFEKLDKTYTDEQKKELDSKGFLFMRPEQIEILYGKDSPYHDEVAHRRLMNVSKTVKTDRQKDQVLEENIHLLAEAEKFKMRKKDIVGSPLVFANLVLAGPTLTNTFIVLSPLVMSPIVLSPAALGPIILSPWVFIPLILSPRVLSPLIVNPIIFSPIVLSPLALHPFILVPGIFNPFVLSPFVLSPFILSPQVFTPFILSPFALSPLILTPMVGSPLVLSPFVLSPIILSPQALFALVLSPYALSPLVESKLIAAELVLSPSWLSFQVVKSGFPQVIAGAPLNVGQNFPRFTRCCSLCSPQDIFAANGHFFPMHLPRTPSCSSVSSTESSESEPRRASFMIHSESVDEEAPPVRPIPPPYTDPIIIKADQLPITMPKKRVTFSELPPIKTHIVVSEYEENYSDLDKGKWGSRFVHVCRHFGIFIIVILVIFFLLFFMYQVTESARASRYNSS